MILSPTDVSGAYMYAYLATAELLGSSKAMTRESVVAEDDIERSYRPRSTSGGDWGTAFLASNTAVSETAPIVIGEARAEDAIIAEISEYLSLGQGWDGYSAAPPSRTSIRSAIRFARVLAGLGLDITPCLHSDGTTIFEIEDSGSLRFLVDGRIAFAFDDGRRGVTEFDGYVIPESLREILNA